MNFLFPFETQKRRKGSPNSTSSHSLPAPFDQADSVPRGDFTLAQGVRVLIGLAWMDWSLTWEKVGTLPTIMSLLALLGGLLIVGISVFPHSLVGWQKIDQRIFVGILLMILIWVMVISPTQGYGNDELTTSQAAANALIGGHNPFGQDLTQILKTFHTPPQISTPLYSGGVVNSVSYPALSFLLYVPLGLLLGTSTNYSLLTDGIFWVILMVILWRILGNQLRILVPLIASTGLFLNYIAGGVTDVLFLPFLCLALYRPLRFLSSVEAGKIRYLGPICLGIACSIKQSPWLIIPFLLASIALESVNLGINPWRPVAKYASLVVGVFLLINGPFIVLNPRAWLHDVLIPFVDPLLPLGKGLVQLPLSLHLAGGNIGFLSFAAIGALIASLGAFILWYPKTRRILPLLASLPLLLSARSLPNYFIYVTILILVCNCGPSISENLLRSAGSRIFKVVKGLSIVGAVVSLVATLAFLTSPAPLALELIAQHTVLASPGHSSISFTVEVSNLTDKPLEPTFRVADLGYLVPVARGSLGPLAIPIHSAVVIELVPSDSSLSLPSGTTYRITATTTTPETFSASEWRTTP